MLGLGPVQNYGTPLSETFMQAAQTSRSLGAMQQERWQFQQERKAASDLETIKGLYAKGGPEAVLKSGLLSPDQAQKFALFAQEQKARSARLRFADEMATGGNYAPTKEGAAAMQRNRALVEGFGEGALEYLVPKASAGQTGLGDLVKFETATGTNAKFRGTPEYRAAFLDWSQELAGAKRPADNLPPGYRWKNPDQHGVGVEPLPGFTPSKEQEALPAGARWKDPNDHSKGVEPIPGATKPAPGYQFVDPQDPSKGETYIPGGPADPKRLRQPSPGYRFVDSANPDKGETYIPGGPADPAVQARSTAAKKEAAQKVANRLGAATSKLSPAALEFIEATNTQGVDIKLPPMGMGKDGAQMRAQIINNMAEDWQAGRLSIDNMGLARATKAAVGKAIGQHENFRRAVENYIGVIDQNVKTIRDYRQKYGTNYGKAINYVANRVRSGAPATGAGDLAALQLALVSLSNEVAKVESGSLGIAEVSQQQASLMHSLHSMNLDASDLDKVLAMSVQLGRNRKRAMDEEAKVLRVRYGETPTTKPEAAPVDLNQFWKK